MNEFILEIPVVGSINHNTISQIYKCKVSFIYLFWCLLIFCSVNKMFPVRFLLGLSLSVNYRENHGLLYIYSVLIFRCIVNSLWERAATHWTFITDNISQVSWFLFIKMKISLDILKCRGHYIYRIQLYVVRNFINSCR